MGIIYYSSDNNPIYNRMVNEEEILVKIAGKEFLDKFNDFYYSFTPYVAEYIGSHSWVRRPIYW